MRRWLRSLESFWLWLLVAPDKPPRPRPPVVAEEACARILRRLVATMGDPNFSKRERLREKTAKSYRRLVRRTWRQDMARSLQRSSRS